MCASLGPSETLSIIALGISRYLSDEIAALSLASAAWRAVLFSRACLRPHAFLLPAVASHQERQRFWYRLCVGSASSDDGASYQELSRRPSEADVQIGRDIGRTFPEDFTESTTQALFRVLRAVAHRLEDVGYCQGMNFVAGMLFRVFGADSEEAETTVYRCMLSLMLRHGMNQYYGLSFPKLRLTALQFDCLVDAYLPELSAALEVYHISADFYATEWFLTLFSYSMPAAHTLRVWDQFLCRGMKFIHRVGLLLLHQARSELIGAGFDDIVPCLRSLSRSPKLPPEEFVQAALEFKVTDRLLCELEHAIAAGASAASPSEGRKGRFSRPLCVLERDLDRGSTRWRVVPRECARNPTEKNNDCVSSVKYDSNGVAFLEEVLPAPLIPADPMASLFERDDMLGHYNSDERGGEVSRLPSRHRHRGHKIKKVLRAAWRRKSGRVGNEAANGFEGTGVSPGADLDGHSSRIGNDRAAGISDDAEVAASAYAQSLASPVGAEVPDHLRPFVVRDLDSGTWSLLEEHGGCESLGLASASSSSREVGRIAPPSGSDAKAGRASKKSWVAGAAGALKRRSSGLSRKLSGARRSNGYVDEPGGKGH